MPFSGNWTVTGTASDLAGLSLDATWSLRTIDDPGIFLEDGFEGSSTAMATTGSVQRVTEAAGIPALSGDYSLLIQPDSSATFHLANPSGATTLRLRVTVLLKTLSPSRRLRIQAGAIGASDSDSAGSTAFPLGTGDATWPYTTAPADVVLEFSQPGDVVLRVAEQACVGSACSPPEAVLIDDVHLN